MRIATVKLCDNSFAVDFNAAPSDHAFVQASFAVLAGGTTDSRVLEERLQVLRPGLGPQVCRRPGAKEKCAQQRHGQTICGKDYEKARMWPGAGAILEDPRRKALYRLYTRRNCHHLNTHDPLKAMGLVANVDDQVVLTCQAAVNYLTKYMGKLGGGHSGSGRIGGLIDDIVCRMRDTDTMTVSSLLCKLFIHAAVPDDICSLEAWHLLWELPRSMSSRYVTALNAKDAIVPMNTLSTIEGGTAADEATQTTKLGQYLQRCQVSLRSPLTKDMLQRMSMSQFFARVDRRGYRHKSCGLRVKSTIVKEKPYLQLDLRKRGVADMARQCLRLHRPFSTAAEDPMSLSDFDAIEQLQAFVKQPQCPVWLKKRFARHNRVKRQSAAGTSGVVAAVRSGNIAVATSQPLASRLDDVQVVEPSLDDDDTAPMPGSSRDKRIVAVQAPGSVAVASHGSLSADASSAPVAASTVSQVVADAGLSDAVVEPPVKKLKTQAEVVQHVQSIDTRENRISVAAQHDLLWATAPGDGRYSVCTAIRKHEPKPSAMIMRQYVQALTQQKPPGRSKTVDLMEQYVYLVLHFDLLPYQKRGAGVTKETLSKNALDTLCNAYFAGIGAKAEPRQKRNWLQMPYACLWNVLKKHTLEQCGLAVSQAEMHRKPCCSGGDTKAAERLGQWYEGVFCLDPQRLEHEEWEDAAEREAKRIRFVQGAMQQQSMGPRRDSLFEADVPFDPGALICADRDTRAEWDALNAYGTLISADLLAPSVAEKMVPEVQKWTLKPSQGGLSHLEAAALMQGGVQQAAAVSCDNLDPTQASFVEHLREWGEKYVARRRICDANLPACAEESDTPRWCEPVLLLGTAGTGKTTTVQAATAVLESLGLAGRIVRAAYTGVAASNLGAGGRTLVSLFRLNKASPAGVLQPLSKEDLGVMTEELGNMCLLVIDEVSMISKAVLAQIHERLQQWRREVYHPQHCMGGSCCCGWNVAFGGLKVVLAGDFGQLPPVAVAAEKTLLNQAALQSGKGAVEVNLGGRLFHSIRNVFRLRRIHRQAGQSVYKESLLRIRDGAHTKEDVALWQSHDLTHPSCTLSVAERRVFEKERVHLFCENRRAGQFNGQRLGEDVSNMEDGSTILRIWSVDSSPAAERHTCDKYGGLRRVLHLAVGAPVMLTTNLRTVWNLVNGARGKVVAVVSTNEVVSADASSAVGLAPMRDCAEVAGVSASAVTYVIVDMPGYVGPTMVEGQPTWVCIPKQQARHETMRGVSRTQFPLVLSYGMTVHKSQGLTLADGCVFNMDHEPTWCPLKCIGLAFVGMSRTKDFAQMAFKYVPDYWAFFSVKDTDIFKWRATLELRLDELHDATAAAMFGHEISVAGDLGRHVAWSEQMRGAALTGAEVADLTHMLSVRGMLDDPHYTDRPKRGSASKAGGGRSKRGVMRAPRAQGQDVDAADGSEPQVCAAEEEDDRQQQLERERREAVERAVREEAEAEQYAMMVADDIAAGWEVLREQEGYGYDYDWFD